MIPIQVEGKLTLEMAVNPGVPRSSISSAARHELIMHEFVPPTIERAYVLPDVRVQGQPLPPLRVRVSGVLRQTRTDGILGLDFLGQYEDIHFHVPTFRLTLNGP